MNDDPSGSGEGREQMGEEELRRRLAEELKKVHVRDVLLQNAITLINVGGQRLGLGDAADARDLEQAKLAIEGVRTTLPLIEERTPGELSPLRDALAQLQMAYAHEVEADSASASGDKPGGEGSQRAQAEQSPQERKEPGSGRPGAGGEGSGGLWVPPGSQT